MKIEFLENLQPLSSLRDYVLEEHWHHEFDEGSQARGFYYAYLGKVLSIKVGQPDKTGVEISSKVSGSGRRPYDVSIALRPRKQNWATVASCSCPVGYQCKHAVATMDAVTKALKALPEPDENQVSDSVAVSAAVKWLHQLEILSEEQVSRERNPHDRFLAYCIEESESLFSSGLELVLRQAHFPRNHDEPPVMEPSRAHPNMARPPKYVSREDHDLITQFQQLRQGSAQSDGLLLQTPGVADLIDRITATGRLFIQLSGTVHRHLSAGPPQPGKPGWKFLTDGRMQPCIELLDATNTMVLLTDQPRYVDTQLWQFGKIESTVSPSLLSMWQSGPPLSHDLIPQVSIALSRLPGQADQSTLPEPIQIESRTVKAKPIPRLHISHHHVRTLPRKNSDRKPIIAADLSFRYGDSPQLPAYYRQPSSGNKVVIQTSTKRTVYHRNESAEEELLEALAYCDFIPLSELLNPNILDPENEEIFVPIDYFESYDAAWFDILHGGTLEDLKKDGWEIIVDPDLGLDLTRVESFETHLEEEQVDGIDWFRFDYTFETEGQTFSLIPLIADYLLQTPIPSPPDGVGEDEELLFPSPHQGQGFISFPKRRFLEVVESIRHLYDKPASGKGFLLHRLEAADVAKVIPEKDSNATIRSLRQLSERLGEIRALPEAKVPGKLKADLRPYQLDGYRWLQFLANQDLHGILADDMGLGKTLQTLTHLLAQSTPKRSGGLPSLVIAPTSVVSNWQSEAARFTPSLKVLLLHGPNRKDWFSEISKMNLVITSYPLIVRDFEELKELEWNCLVLDEAQQIKNPKSNTAQTLYQVKARHRVCLSGTPMENHLGELWSLMRFLMPGYLGSSEQFSKTFRTPIEKQQDGNAQVALNRRVGPLLLRRTKDEVATDLPEKTEIVHSIPLTTKQTDLYESVRAAMDRRIRDAISEKGLGRSQIVVLDALLKLRQICCHPQLLDTPAARKAGPSAKLDFLTIDLLPTLLEDGRKILLFSQFTIMLELIEQHLQSKNIDYIKLTGSTPSTERAKLVKAFQAGKAPLFLISLKAGGTGLNLTAADTVIHYDQWWNPAAEAQATDRAHRIGQDKPVFVHKLICKGSIEERIQQLQQRKSNLVKALLSEEVSKLKIDSDTLSQLLAPM